MSRVVVLGNINMDIVAYVKRLPLATQSIQGDSLSYYAGGKGFNQAVGASKMGVETIFVGALGKDSFADKLLAFCKKYAIDTSNISFYDGSSGIALIYIAKDGTNSIVVINGANNKIKKEQFKNIIARDGDIFLAQLEMPLHITKSFLEYAKACGSKTILNLAPAIEANKLISLADILVLNEIELSFYIDKKITQDTKESQLIDFAKQIKIFNKQVVILTLGARGSLVLDGNKAMFIKALAVRSIDTVGAGDCFIGVLASLLASGFDMKKATQKANLAATLSTTKRGSAESMPYKRELASFEDKKTY